MTTMQKTAQTTTVTMQLGEEVPADVGERARDLVGDLLARAGRSGTPVHVRIIRDHDPDLPAPVTARAMLDGREAARVQAGTAGDAVDALVDRLAGVLHV